MSQTKTGSQYMGVRNLTDTPLSIYSSTHFFLPIIHDITVLRELGLLEHAEESVQIIGDKGYIGEEYV